MYFITTKRMLEVCFSAHPNIQYRTFFSILKTVTCARSVLLFTALLKSAAPRTVTRSAMHRNGKQRRFAPYNSGFSCKIRTKTPRGIWAVNSNRAGHLL